MALDWARDGADWPHREHSRFVATSQLRWHVQRWPAPKEDAALVLLLHGTGAATHSWRDFAPLLAEQFAVLAVDLPGHGFTRALRDGGAAPLSMPGMARALAELLQAIALSPQLIVGHSAGAAIALRLCLSGLVQPQQVIGLNAALLPLSGLAGQVFSPVAKLMALMPGVPQLFARRAQDAGVLERLLDGTGSQIDATGRALYRRLVSDPGHVAGALGMMARWDLPTLAAELPQLHTPLDLVVGLKDRTIPPAQAEAVLARLPAGLGARAVYLEGLGHLAHEEAPAQVAALVASLWAEARR